MNSMPIGQAMTLSAGIGKEGLWRLTISRLKNLVVPIRLEATDRNSVSQHLGAAPGSQTGAAERRYPGRTASHGAIST
jgi:hypothetical protein